MTAWLWRTGFASVSKHTVDRLMRLEGMIGPVRGRKPRNRLSIALPAPRAPALLDRQFSAPTPSDSGVTDFTYVATWGGFVVSVSEADICTRSIDRYSADKAGFPMITNDPNIG